MLERDNAKWEKVNGYDERLDSGNYKTHAYRCEICGECIGAKTDDNGDLICLCCGSVVDK